LTFLCKIAKIPLAIFIKPVLKIRFQRQGRTKRPFYRIVVAEHSAPVQGKFIEIVGHFNPLSKEVEFKNERIIHFVNNGAQPSQTVARLGAKNGIKEFEKFLKKRIMKPSKAEIEAKKKAEEEAKAKEEEAKAKAEAAEEAKKAEEETQAKENEEVAAEEKSSEEVPAETKEEK